MSGPHPDLPMSEAWWRKRFEGDVAGVISALAACGLTLEGSRVIDVACAYGVLALGLAQRGADITAYDVDGVNTVTLAALAEEFAGIGELPASLTASHRNPTEIPLPDASVDIALHWDQMDRLEEPVALFSEIARVLRPQRHLVMRAKLHQPAVAQDAPPRTVMALDELQRCVQAAGLRLAWVDVTASPRHLDADLERFPLSRTALDEVTIVAVRGD
ncbi:class I SAM-dependent methyltransferase [Paraconexibacter sp.]|uniref:class I SAM-dependent methyltransferase n=1 Tax=Paraconexibacter sp. TaxID=2949640 RepID=UPI003567FB36